MAFLHMQADIKPTKLELLAAWLPTRPWYAGPAAVELARVSACRFDDPAGEVGIETILVDAGDGAVLHTPLTYRGAPLEGAQEWLVGTTEHSELGPRWVYDACGDPVYAQELARMILTGQGQADEVIEVDGQTRRREPIMVLRGAAQPSAVPVIGAIRAVNGGDPTVILTDSVELSVVRVLGRTNGQSAVMTGTWQGQADPVVLAHARRA